MLHRPVRLGRVAATIAIIAELAACAQVPRESVELSVTLGRDLEEVHRANRELAVRYFERMYRDVDTFVSEVYRPFIIRHTIESLDLLTLLQEGIDSDTLDPLDIMEIFADETIAKITAYRTTLRQPIERREGEVLRSIDDAFHRLHNVNAVVTAHLASVRKVHDVQAELTRAAGVGDLRSEVGGRVAELSDSLEHWLSRARGVAGLLEAGVEGLEDVERRLDELSRQLQQLESPRPEPAGSQPNSSGSDSREPKP